jgi:hypothetical protein
VTCKSLAFTILLAGLLIGLLSEGVLPGQTSSQELENIQLDVAFTQSSFANVNQTDAMAAFKAFTMRMGRLRGYNIKLNVYILDKASDLSAVSKRGNMDLLIVDAWDYLSHAPFKNTSLEFATIEQGQVLEPYLVLAKAESSINSIKDLKGKHVLVLKSSNASNGHHWFRTELLKMGFADPNRFVKRLEIKSKLSRAVLPVFFSQADACIVDQAGFKIMVEMNPQIGKELQIIAQSPHFVDTLCCLRSQGWLKPYHRGDMSDALAKIADDPAGQQILNLFKFNGLTPFKEKYLDTIRILRQQHDTLMHKLSPGKTG